VIFLGDFSFVRIFLKNLYRVTMTTSSVVGLPTGDTFIPRDISVGILKPQGCSYHCDSGGGGGGVWWRWWSVVVCGGGVWWWCVVEGEWG
jgi:hypothetical protein